jgi:hypothetical protein
VDVGLFPGNEIAVVPDFRGLLDRHDSLIAPWSRRARTTQVSAPGAVLSRTGGRCPWCGENRLLKQAALWVDRVSKAWQIICGCDNLLTS